MLERDIETAYIDWVNAQPNHKVYGRQVHLPFGILDVLFLVSPLGGCDPIVAEIKAGVVDEKALTQVVGYADQLSALLSCRVGVIEPFTDDIMVECSAVLVGTHMTERVERIHKAFGVSFVQYSVDEQGRISFQDWPTYGAELYDYKPNKSILDITAAIRAWRTDHRRRNVANLGDGEIYENALTGRYSKPAEGVEGTVAYWQRAKVK